MNTIIYFCLLLARSTHSLRISSANELSDSSRVDTVLILKTLDTGSSFLDRRVFGGPPSDSRQIVDVVIKPGWFGGQTVKEERHYKEWQMQKEGVKHPNRLSMVSRWYEEFNEHRPQWQDMANLFVHRPGEQIVGGSYNFGDFNNDTDYSKINDVGFAQKFVPHILNGDFGKVLIIKLYRNPIAKWMSIMRATPGSPSYACSKTCHGLGGLSASTVTKENHSPDYDECFSGACEKATYVKPDEFLEKVSWNEGLDENIDKIINDIKAANKPHIVFETFLYDDLVGCQGVPQYINRHLGNDTDGCDREKASMYQQKNKKQSLKDVVANHDELRQKFAGTKWEKLLAEPSF